MGGFSIWHWLVFGAVLVFLGYPAARILRRLGFSRWWVILAFIPYANLLGLWILAFIRWPIDRR
ncbi:hypothetical protein [uncultured Brevundimonas sp.]|uniref:hypothetical protein n=1 Tax=Brevundimonas sp. CEF1 TaxID=3442642 RepID=UPI000FC15AEF|nr:hypothetical protein [uncultured Brevundimonas sp.]